MGHFQVDRNKNSKGTDQLSKVKSAIKEKDMSRDEKYIHQMKLWTTFYRRNMHRFIEHYFGIELHFFQKILLYFMNINSVFFLIASRGLGKSFLIAIYVCAKCTLYPETKCVIASGIKKQSKLIITEKIEKELKKFPNLAREIQQIKGSGGDATVIFHNGSTIEAVTSSENSRGYRANLLILEEFRMIKKEILDSVLKPFLNVYRQPPFLKKPQYKHLTEENVEIYISSAWYTSHWMWKDMLLARDAMLKGKDTVIFALDYLTSLHHGLLSKKRVEKEAKGMDDILFDMEYNNLMYGQNSDALIALDDINKNRTLKNAFYPIDNLDYEVKKKKKKEKLKDGEIRILSIDVALMGGKANDNTIVSCIRLLPNGDKYERKVPYIESIEGGHTDDQAIRIKQLFEDFQASKIALDCGGNGMSIYDALVKIQYDEERDVEYDAWTCYNDEEMAKRAKTQNPLPIIFSVKANAKFNNEIARSLRTELQQSNIELPISEIEAREILSEKKYYQDALTEKKVEYVRPFLQSTMMVNEIVNLQYEVVGGLIKVKEKSGARKDRYSSLAYGNYLAKVLELENLSTESDDYDEDDDFVYY